MLAMRESFNRLWTEIFEDKGWCETSLARVSEVLNHQSQLCTVKTFTASLYDA